MGKEVKKASKAAKEIVLEEKQDNDIVITGEGIQKAVDLITNHKDVPLPKKTAMGYINATSLRDLIRQVNSYNEYYPDYPILKEDVVSVLKEGEGYVLLYYRYGK